MSDVEKQPPKPGFAVNLTYAFFIPLIVTMSLNLAGERIGVNGVIFILLMGFLFVIPLTAIFTYKVPGRYHRKIQRALAILFVGIDCLYIAHHAHA